MFLGEINNQIVKKSDLLIGIPYRNRSDLLIESVSSVIGKGDILIINNSCKPFYVAESTTSLQKRNIGVAASWNLIINYAIKYDYKYILISSNDFVYKNGNIEFGLLDFINSDCILGSIDEYNSFFIRPNIVDIVGWFDENYYPGYCEDTDYSYRIWLSGNRTKKLNIGGDPPVHYRSQTVLSDQEILSKFEYTYSFNKIYFKEKWGVWDQEMVDIFGPFLFKLFNNNTLDLNSLNIWKNPKNDPSLSYKDWSPPKEERLNILDWDNIKNVVKKEDHWALDLKGM